MRTLLLLAALSFSASCKDKDSNDSTPVVIDETGAGDDSDGGGGDSEDSGSGEELRPGVLRLGPPAPAVGAYGVAASPSGGPIYVSNLHVPFITVADPITGEWIDSLDIRDAGIDEPWFPQLFVFDGALWATHFTDGSRFFRFDLATHEPLDMVELPDGGAGVTVTDEGVWVALRDGRVQRYNGPEVAEEVVTTEWGAAIAVEGDTIALLNGSARSVSLYSRSGNRLWTVSMAERYLSDVEIIDGRVFVCDRELGDVIAIDGGEVVDRVYTGSDTFALYREGSQLLVVNRQGAVLPESGAYQGGPGRVTRLTRDLAPVWTVDVAKTVHFLAWDGASWWTANEDSLQLSAIDPAGSESLRGPRLGLTLDHIEEIGGRYFMGSHLTDELWRADFDTSEAVAADTCGWPFQAVPVGETAWVPCQESGDVWGFDPEAMTLVDQLDVADTFHPACDAGLCTGHSQLIGGAADGDRMVFSDLAQSTVRWSDGEAVALAPIAEAQRVRHFDLEGVDGAVLAFEPRDARVYRIVDGAVTGNFLPAGEPSSFALVVDDQRVWVGYEAVDFNLVPVTSLPAGVIVEAAGAGVIVGTDGTDLVTFDRETLTEAGRISLTDLRVPPWPRGEDLGPMRYHVNTEGDLVLANVFRGTLERRSLPDLAPVGADEIVPVGRWSHLDGVR